jgi:hypothetical protein
MASAALAVVPLGIAGSDAFRAVGSANPAPADQASSSP